MISFNNDSKDYFMCNCGWWWKLLQLCSMKSKSMWWIAVVITSHPIRIPKKKKNNNNKNREYETPLKDSNLKSSKFLQSKPKNNVADLYQLLKFWELSHTAQELTVCQFWQWSQCLTEHVVEHLHGRKVGGSDSMRGKTSVGGRGYYFSNMIL